MIAIPRDPEHEDTYQDGVRDERARVQRIRDAVFAGQVLDDDTRALLAKFDALLVRGDSQS